jgi:hypothetical protein
MVDFTQLLAVTSCLDTQRSAVRIERRIHYKQMNSLFRWDSTHAK